MVPNGRRKGAMAVTSATRALRGDTAPETLIWHKSQPRSIFDLN